MDYFVNGERATALVFEIILLAVATCSAHTACANPQMHRVRLQANS